MYSLFVLYTYAVVEDSMPKDLDIFYNFSVSLLNDASYIRQMSPAIKSTNIGLCVEFNGVVDTFLILLS